MILVTGASGFVGQKIIQMYKDAIACPSLRDMSEDAVCRIVWESGADTIIHTAAISDIGVCQANPEASYIANVQLPVYLAKAVRRASERIKLICFSSDQVYSGLDDEGPYTEDMAGVDVPIDIMKPANLYAEHKLEMERRVLDLVPDAVMLRAEWMYDYYLKKPNYFMQMIRAKESVSFGSRQYRGITYVKEAAANMKHVISLPGGIYNFGSETTKSMYEITRAFLDMIGREKIKVEDASVHAPLRHNLWMNCEKARKYGVVFRTVEDGLKMCAGDYKLLK